MFNTIGVIGLGVMGSNIALNMASKVSKWLSIIIRGI